MLYYSSMGKLASTQFHAALSYLLKKEGRGSQTRLSSQQSIDRGYLNAIIKGRKPGSEEVRAKIAAHFNLAYEEMLVLGRTLLEGEGTKDYVQTGSLETTSSKTKPAASDVFGKGAREGRLKPLEEKPQGRSDLSEQFRKVSTILESETKYRDILNDLIDAFYAAVDSEKNNMTMRQELQEMAARIERLERKDAEKIQYRESA